MTKLAVGKRPRGRPPREIPLHRAQIRIDKPLWDEFERATLAQGTTASHVLRDCVLRYVRRFVGER